MGEEIYHNGNLKVEIPDDLKRAYSLPDQMLMQAIVHSDWKNAIGASMISALAQGKAAAITVSHAHFMCSELEVWFQRFFPGIKLTLEVIK